MSTEAAQNGKTHGERFIDEMMALSVGERTAKLREMKPTAFTAAVITRTLLDESSRREALILVRDSFAAHFTPSSHREVMEVFRWCELYIDTPSGGPRLWAHQEMATFLHQMLSHTPYRMRQLTSAGNGPLYTSLGRSIVSVDPAASFRYRLVPRDVVVFNEHAVTWQRVGRGRRRGELSDLVLLDPRDLRNAAACV